MSNVKQDPFFEEPQVGAVTQQSVNPPVYGFDMEFGFTYTPKQPGAPGADATTTTATTGTTSTTGTASPGKPGGTKK